MSDSASVSDVLRDTFKLPKLPGNNFQSHATQKSFGKKQHLGPQGITGCKVEKIPVDFETLKIKEDRDAEPPKPQTLSLDRKVLRFSAFFKEPVHESREESARVRRCMVYYFLEDDTMSVAEPKEDNSGMPQGNMLKRHLVTKADGQPFSYADLNVGQEISVYGKTFRLVDCDAYTRKFLTGIGIEVPPGELFPVDSFQQARSQPGHRPRDPEDSHLKAVMEYGFSGKRSRLAPHEVAATRKFLENDRKVLKFRARWDDRPALYGDDRRFLLYYFLADDTIEVTEELAVNAGRDPFPSFTRRQRCPKPGNSGRFENPSASLSFKGRRGDESAGEAIYTEADLHVGAVVNVFGRNFLLYDADEFTKRYLKDHFGKDSSSIDVKEPEAPPKRAGPPPHNGFGDEEDSLGSWKNLVLKPPRKNVRQYIENAGSMLKFAMRLDKAGPADAVRRFVLTYYLADDTVSIFEPAQRNSGIIGGKFLQRQKARNSDTGETLRASDFYVGAKIAINKHRFVVYATDEKSLTHMEQHSGSFNQSNINAVMNKLRAMLLSRHTDLEAHFHRADRDGSGGVDYKELATIFADLKLPVTEQEVLTVLRFLDTNLDGQLTYSEVVRRILPDGGANSVDEPWHKILAEVDREINWEHTLAVNETRRADEHFAATAAHAARYLLDRYAERRVLFNNAFRSCADHSPDGKIGAEEFTKAVDAKLHLGFDQRQLDALCAKLFPPPMERQSYDEFLRLMQGTSLHPCTVTSIAQSK
eukprot:TRINITY_DN47376_c0_g1_i1.p1 TRINITY_DN47376_c0_g1~~TRINITY_DN47376_c0_g1_i1.p1  ORF type:complete len:757 (+),score=291.09 TRINITY_DN47376_c0_g1_i1:107-2377(+)